MANIHVPENVYDAKPTKFSIEKQEQWELETEPKLVQYKIIQGP